MRIEKKLHLLFLLFFFGYMNAAEYNHHFYAGPQHSYRRMYFNNPCKLDGFMTGVATGYTFNRNWFLTGINYEGYWSTGLLHGYPCQVSKVHEHLLTWRIGGSWNPRECFSFDGYTGFGFNRFFNHQDPADEGCNNCDTSCTKTCPTPCTTNSCNTTPCTTNCKKDCKISCKGCCTYKQDGLAYKYTKLFVPIGMSANWHVTDFTTVSLCAEWRPDVYAKLNALCCDIKNERRHAVRVALPIRHEIHCNTRFTVTFEPFFDWNRFGGFCCLNQDSNAFGLSKLTRWDVGMRCLLGVQF